MSAITTNTKDLLTIYSNSDFKYAVTPKGSLVILSSIPIYDIDHTDFNQLRKAILESELKTTSYRLYRTQKGFRIIASYIPESLEREFRLLEVDPLYIKLYKKENFFIARLTPKKWRLNESRVCELIETNQPIQNPSITYMKVVMAHDAIAMRKWSFLNLLGFTTLQYALADLRAFLFQVVPFSVASEIDEF